MSEFLAANIWPDALVERSIFGTDNPAEIWAHVRSVVPEAVDCFHVGVSVGALFGVVLADGRRVALKVHRDGRAAYLEAMQFVQEHLWRRGFPCPRPLGRRGAATLEEWCDEGGYRDAHEPEVRRALASALVDLIRCTDELGRVRGMRREFFPRGEGALWPVPHNVLFDFEATAPGAEWIDEIALSAKPIRDAGAGRRVIAHGDWSVKHFRFDGVTPTVVYDWDSLNTDFEPLFVGVAAATFVYTEHLPVRLWPSLEEAQAFLDDYETARGVAFTAAERRAAGASATYTSAYSARCVHAVGGDARRLPLEDFADAFL